MAADSLHYFLNPNWSVSDKILQYEKLNKLSGNKISYLSQYCLKHLLLKVFQRIKSLFFVNFYMVFQKGHQSDQLLPGLLYLFRAYKKFAKNRKF